jgi:NADH-ubiquinone oxidoreductase chain 5
MAAPTPVSALVHSSTLVTAGVYILIRHTEIFFLNSISIVLVVMGTATIIMARFRALFESDLKKMVALSTLSQLGVMILSLGLGAFFVSFFHLLSHAFFKALLFLTAGAIIHGRSDYQDLRLMGNRAFSLPIVNRFTIISVFSLIGVPLISAFFSKELVLETILLFNHNAVIYYFIIFGVGLTAAYRRRFLSFIFRRPANRRLLVFKLDEDVLVIIGIITLVLPAVIGGFILNYLLQTSFKVRSAPGLLKLAIVLILGLAGYLLFFQSFLNLKSK